VVADETRRFAEEAADALRDLLSVDPTPPVDIDRLAFDLGLRIWVRPMIGEGRLEIDDEAPRILVQARAGRTRRRFTIAHELGHYWLHAIGKPVDLDFHAEERFCNEFAAELLLPAAWVTKHARQPPSLAGLLEVASIADASLPATFIRLRADRDWRKRTLLTWRLDEEHWRIQHATGLPRRLNGYVKANAVTKQTLDLLAKARAGVVVSGQLTLDVCATPRPLEVQLRAQGNSAVVLTDFGRVVPRCRAVPKSAAERLEAKRGRVHTIHALGRWVTEIDGEKRLGKEHITRSFAIAEAERLAQTRGVEHVIHNIDGSVFELNDYRRANSARL
jgi:hypothetical protein